MELATITMPKDEARLMREEYRALGKRTTEEDAALIRVLDEVVKGREVVDVASAIPAGGFDENGCPKLAFGAADVGEVMCWRAQRHVGGGNWENRGELHFRPTRIVGRSWSQANERRQLTIPWSRLAGWPALGRTWYAMTPTIPAALRPPHALANYHILWEAEWAKTSALIQPPRDPALLKHITGTLYAVLAVWDLTDVERAVLGMVRGAAIQNAR